jgi:hypothetical protein
VALFKNLYLTRQVSLEQILIFNDSRAVMSEQGVQDETEHAPLRGPRVEDQRAGCVVYRPLPPGGGPSGSPRSSCRGRCLVPGFLA